MLGRGPALIITMIWRWAIFFSAVSVAVQGATVTGSVEITNSREAAVRKHKDYTGVVLWLSPADRPAPLPAPKRVQMIQREKRFIPHLIAVPVGSTVDLPNYDPIFHSAFSNFSGQIFDLGL